MKRNHGFGANVISGSNVDTVVFNSRFPGTSRLASLHHPGTALPVSTDTASPVAAGAAKTVIPRES